MAEKVFKAAFLSIGGTDISGKALDAVTLTTEVETLDNTHMGDNTRTNLAGLKNWGLSVDVTADFGATGLESILWAAYDAGDPVAVVFRPDVAAIGVSNPQYSGQGIISSFQPVGGSVGELAKGSFEIVPAGDLSRAPS